MRRTVLAPGLACVLLLTACGGEELTPEERAQEERESAERIEEALGTSTATTAAAEDAFLTAARGSGLFDAVSDSALLSAGHETCGALDRGVSPMEIALMGFEESESSGQAGMVVLGAAASTLCREHMTEVQKLAETLGG
jgi:hypothetical protein